MGAAMIAGFFALSLGTGPAGATAMQNWQTDWESIRILCPDPNDVCSDDIDTSASASGSGGGGTLTVDPTLPSSLSFVSGSLTLDFDKASGKLRSRSDIDAKIDGLGGGNPTQIDQITKFHFDSSNKVEFTDQLTVGAGNWGRLEVTIRTDGRLQHNAQITEPGGSYLELNNDIDVQASLAGGGSGSLTQHIDSKLSGDAPGPDSGKFSKSDHADINDQFTLVIPFTNDVIGFSFSYLETLSLDMDGIDAEYVEFSSINNFGSTLDLFASVYDVNGQLMQGATVSSTEGISYQTLAQVPTPTVPLPAAWLLFAAGMAGLATQRRMRRQG